MKPAGKDARSKIGGLKHRGLIYFSLQYASHELLNFSFLGGRQFDQFGAVSCPKSSVARVSTFAMQIVVKIRPIPLLITFRLQSTHPRRFGDADRSRSFYFQCTKARRSNCAGGITVQCTKREDGTAYASVKVRPASESVDHQDVGRNEAIECFLDAHQGASSEELTRIIRRSFEPCMPPS